MSFILQKLIGLIKKASYPWNDENLRQVKNYLEEEKEIDYLLGIEGEEITNQLSFFDDIRTDDEKEISQDDTLMQSRMLNARFLIIEYINALGIDEYTKRRDYIIDLIMNNKLVIDDTYRRILLNLFCNITKEMREYNQRLKRKIKKEKKPLFKLS